MDLAFLNVDPYDLSNPESLFLILWIISRVVCGLGYKAVDSDGFACVPLCSALLTGTGLV